MHHFTINILDFMSDWALEYLDRLFLLFSQLPELKKGSNAVEVGLVEMIGFTGEFLFSRMSSKTLSICLSKVESPKKIVKLSW